MMPAIKNSETLMLKVDKKQIVTFGIIFFDNCTQEGHFTANNHKIELRLPWKVAMASCSNIFFSASFLPSKGIINAKRLRQGFRRLMELEAVAFCIIAQKVHSLILIESKN